MSTLESLKYDEDHDYALEWALDHNKADYCDCHGKPYKVEDLTEICGKLYCPDGLEMLEDSPDEA